MRALLLLGSVLLGTAAGAGEEAPEGWLSRVQRDIAASEYHLTWRPEIRGFEAPNRAQGLRATFLPTGTRLAPRAEESWTWGLDLRRWGRPHALSPVQTAEPRAGEARVEYARGHVLEWYVNGPGGIEQGFTLDASPVEPGTVVVLDLALSGTLLPVVAEDGQAIDFTAAQGAKALHYAQLVVTDATGRTLRSWMEGTAGGVRLAFEDDGAVYPVTVDPLATTPAWTTTGTGLYGATAATAGDVNGDGYSDVVVGAYMFFNTAPAGSGRVYLYHGGPSGPSTSPATTLINPVPGASTRLGWDVNTAGDVNGDGYADLVVVMQSDQPGVPCKTMVYLGSAAGLATSPAWTVDTGGNYAFAATAGDVNGDGYSDVVVGFRQARVYHGSATGLSTTPAWSIATDIIHVGTAGDVNGDGYADVILGSPGPSILSSAYVYQGSSTGLAASPAWSVTGTQQAGGLGYAVSTAGDVNGDGYADVLVGDRYYDGPQDSSGRAWVYLGSAGGLAASASWVGDGQLIQEGYGEIVSTAGDVNGDGFADIVVGAPSYPAPFTRSGRAYAYFGSAFGLASAPGWTTTGTQTSQQIGAAAATAGDVNGDGYADVLVGSSANFAELFLGSASGVSQLRAWNREGDQDGAIFGLSLAGAGDVDGDGYADVLVGAPWYDDGHANEGLALLYRGLAVGLDVDPAWSVEGNSADANLGWAVAGAGDVNGDGYADAVVGAPGWSSGQAGEGQARVFLGSAAGLAASPAWTVESDSTSAAFGRAVAPAGDVNGDGFGDVLVSAPFLDHELTDEGKAFLYLGGAGGLSTSAAWTAEGDQASAQYGWGLGTAGDTNRDGFADVLVGAPGFGNGQALEGRAFLYLGSASGLAATAAWTAESNQVNAFLGRSVGTAGDVNGDGYADGLVGAEGFTNGQAAEGRVWMYLGGVSGLAISPVWSAESDQAGAHFGYPASSAGDVNGDGFSDVIVGAPDYDVAPFGNAGRAYVFTGNLSGLSLVPQWMMVGDEPSAFLGAAVAGIGDVNGDGYADVAVGSPFDDNDQIDEGRVQVFLGGGGQQGRPLRARQRRVLADAPLARFGVSDSASSIRLDLFGRSPFGRGKVRTEWEVKPVGTGFDGTGTQLDPTWVDSGVAGTLVAKTVSGLASSTRYHWRVRFHYDAKTTPFAQRSRWVTVPWGGWNEAMLRTAALPAGDLGGLVLAKAGGGQVALSWGASCTLTDDDYAAYEGTLGSWSTHQPRTCSTLGITAVTLTPSAGSAYYLVVPRNSGREGSYGKTSAGAERPAASAACVQRELAVCP